jgi:hypothetical protein|tara:strand:- start:464 stop:967 length:504 start_codon:yes stop_codon:yes gene_type:complete
MNRKQLGTAGYISPFPYVEKLQTKMDEILSDQVPNNGTFCSFCYGRIDPTEEKCAFCENLNYPSPVDKVPKEVLSIYQAKRRTESIWVYTGALFGLMLAAGLFLILVLWGPGFLGHPGFAFLVLIGGGYLLAQLCGPLICGQVGYRKGATKRDFLWATYLEKTRPTT